MRDWPVQRLLDAIGERTAAPGGGSAAGCACALAAGLVEMAARFGPDELREQTAERAGELRRRALELAELELDSYEPVLEALQLSREDPERERRLRETRSAAAETPLELARVAAEAAELGARVAAGGSRHLVGDAVTGVLLAEAACRAAAELVAINLAHAPDDSRRYLAYDLGRRAHVAREETLPAG